MALSTQQSRNAWSPACRRRHPFRVAYVALDAWLRAFGYRPGHGTGAANCRKITGGLGYSLHAYFGDDDFTFWNGYRLPMTALATDINPPKNPYSRRLITDMPRAMVDAIVGVRTNSGHQVWGWGGYFRTYKDAMHYEVVCTPAQLRTGINPRTLPGAAATPVSRPPPPSGDIMYRILWFQGEPTAPGPQPDQTAAYRCLMGKCELTGKLLPVVAFYLDGDAYALFKKQGLVEDPVRHPIASSLETVLFYGGPGAPFRNT